MKTSGVGEGERGGEREGKGEKRQPTKNCMKKKCNKLKDSYYKDFNSK